jgi:hypothetical protein
VCELGGTYHPNLIGLSDKLSAKYFMAKSQGKITKLDLRIPNDLYAQIELIAIQEGAKNHHLSGKPTLSPTAIKLLQEAVEQRNYVSPDSEEERLSKAETLIVEALQKITTKLAELDKRPTKQIILGGTLLRTREQIETIKQATNDDTQQLTRRSRTSGSDELKSQ